MKNIKTLFSICFSLMIIFLSINAFGDSDIDLSMHGKDLRRASFDLRHSFKRKYKKDWFKSSYAQREEFLINYYKQLAKEEKEAYDKEVIKEQAAMELERQKNEAERVLIEKQAQRERQEEEKRRIEEEKQKRFEDRIAKQKNKIEELRRKQEVIRD